MPGEPYAGSQASRGMAGPRCWNLFGGKGCLAALDVVLGALG